MDMTADQTDVRHPDPARAWSAISVAESVREGPVGQSGLALNLEEGKQEGWHEIDSVGHPPPFRSSMG